MARESRVGPVRVSGDNLSVCRAQEQAYLYGYDTRILSGSGVWCNDRLRGVERKVIGRSRFGNTSLYYRSGVDRIFQSTLNGNNRPVEFRGVNRAGQALRPQNFDIFKVCGV